MTIQFGPFSAIEEAECLADKGEKALMLDAAIRHLDAIPNRNSARVQYALGYAWYIHPLEGPERESSVEEHLVEALRIEPQHLYARLYLAHLYFDGKHYLAALKLLEVFDQSEFREMGQPWRDAKVAEMILCCRLYLKDADGIKGSLRMLCEVLTGLEPGMNPDPEELAASLLSLVFNSRDPQLS